MKNNWLPPKKNQNFTRLNFQIRVPQVRVIGSGGEQLGVMKTDDARKLAIDQELDLVETVPHASPPVCTICDYGKLKFEQKIKQKESQKRQRESKIEIKEVRFSPRIGDHDIDTKTGHILGFLAERKSVVVKLEFKRREITHKEEGWAVINKVVAKVEPTATLSQRPRLDGKFITCRFDPK
jgi:translation initiation factor IF-3